MASRYHSCCSCHPGETQPGPADTRHMSLRPDTMGRHGKTIRGYCMCYHNKYPVPPPPRPSQSVVPSSLKQLPPRLVPSYFRRRGVSFFNLRPDLLLQYHSAVHPSSVSRHGISTYFWPLFLVFPSVGIPPPPPATLFALRIVSPSPALPCPHCLHSTRLLPSLRAPPLSLAPVLHGAAGPF